MREWREAIRREIAGAGLAPAEEASVIEELAQHLEDRHAEVRASGASAEEADRVVLAELASGDDLSRALRRVRVRTLPDAPLGGTGPARPLTGLWQDVRYALRTFVKQPTFAVAAVVALGLGAGAATAVFSLLDAVVLRGLPYADAERLVMLWDTNAEEELTHEPLSPVNVLDYRAAAGVFEDVGVWWRPEINLTDDTGEPMRVKTVEASENLDRKSTRLNS